MYCTEYRISNTVIQYTVHIDNILHMHEYKCGYTCLYICMDLNIYMGVYIFILDRIYIHALHRIWNVEYSNAVIQYTVHSTQYMHA